MKKNTQKFMAGLLSFSIMVSGGFLVANANNKTDDLTVMDSAMLQQPTTEELIEAAKSLSAKEKQQLLKEYETIKPFYKDIDKLLEKQNKIKEEILAKNQHIFDEYYKIIASKQELWDKFYDNLTEAQAFSSDQKQSIKDSKALTKEEKNILLKEQEKLETFDEKINAVYEKIEKETESLRNELDSLYEKVDKVYVNNKLWDKVYTDEIFY